MSAFQPSTGRAQAVDVAVRDGLAHSLMTLLAEEMPAEEAWFRDIASTAPPVVFGLYFDLLIASQRGGGPGVTEARTRLLDALQRQPATRKEPPDSKHTEIVTLAQTTAGDEACLRRWLDLEPDNHLALIPLAPRELELASNSVRQALAVMAQLLPEFHGEFNAITRQVIFAKPDGTQRLTFGGASSFALWGALALNSDAHPHWYDYLPRIAHEYAHNLLFGLAMREPLVLNDPAQRIASPLRGSDRPVDGVYHAAFVSARQALALHRLASALELGAEAPDRQELLDFAHETFVQSLATFHACHAALQEHALFSDLGATILADTHAAMGALQS